jgi:quercetin dioxygenase-like cupin family protein
VIEAKMTNNTGSGTGGAPLREVLASTDGLRVQMVTIAPGQEIPRHRHSQVVDTLIAVQGTTVIEIDGEAAPHRLEPGDRLTIPVGTVHRVRGEHDGACRFINLHAGGAYDFVPSV